MRLPLPIAAAAIALLLAACSSPAAPSPAKHGAKPAASASSASSLAVATLTGAQLDAALAHASSFPGFTVITKYAYQGGTGTGALPSQYSLARMSCTRFSTQILFATEFGQTAIAWTPFTRVTGAQSNQNYDEFIYQFADDGTASSFMQRLRSDYRRCRSYTDVEDGYTVRTTYVVAHVAPVAGGQAIQVTVTAVASPLTVAGEVLYVLSRNVVYGVVRVGTGTTIPASPAARAVIKGMMKQVQA